MNVSGESKTTMSVSDNVTDETKIESEAGFRTVPTSHPLGFLSTIPEAVKVFWTTWHRRLTAESDRSELVKKMVLDAYCHKSIIKNVSATFSTSILLVGFLSAPAALPKFQRSSAVESMVGDGMVLHAIRSIPILCVGVITLFFGGLGIYLLWRGERKKNEDENFIWVKDRLFYPAFLRAIIGLTTALARVLAESPPAWSPFSVTVVVVTSAAATSMLGLMLLYQIRILRLVDGDRKVEQGESRTMDKEDEIT